MNPLRVIFMGLCALVLILNISVCQAKVPESFVKSHSQKVEDKVDPLIESRFKQLQTQTPDTSRTSFSHGFISISSEGLVWRDRGGVETLLASNEGLQEGYRISGFLISPDSKKVAFYTTFNGQDLKFWNIVTLNKSPATLLKTPIENRMEGFSWNKNSDGLYYSFFHPKEAVKKNEKPILEVRYREISSGKDTVVFSPGLAENFGIADIDGGQTLVAYRLLVSNSGIKTTFSLYKGERDEQGGYNWQEIYPRNKHVAVFLGVYKNQPIVLTSGEGDTYGISAIDLQTAEVNTLVPSDSQKVLHIAELVDDKLILQYHSIPEQNVSLKIVQLKTGQSTTIDLSSLGLSSFGTMTKFNFGPGSRRALSVFSDVKTGKHVLALDLVNDQLKRLPNKESLDFDASQMQQELFQFSAENGKWITGRVYTRKGVKPQFVFIRYYGWISIKNSPEPREVQMALELGGAYVTVDLPGGGERGAQWFLDGSSQRLEMIKNISETSTYFQEQFSVGSEKIVAMGRSWGGLTSLILAAKHGNNFGVVIPVVPVIDLKSIFEEGWFGRIAHSDLAPQVDAEGNYILGPQFDAYVESINPVHHITEIPEGTHLQLFTNGLDDRVDQGGDQEAEFAHALEKQVGEDSFYYHRSIKGNHGNRYYQVLIFSLLADHFDLNYEVMKK